jgi:hypothetical protein
MSALRLPGNDGPGIGVADEPYLNWPQKDLEANAAFMQSFTQKLAAAGELAATYGLTSPAQAKLVRKGSEGKPVTDGVFPESKEFRAGWWIVDVEDERLRGSHRVDAVRAHLLERAGKRDDALVLYRQAAAKTARIPERDYLLKKASRLTGVS